MMMTEIATVDGRDPGPGRTPGRFLRAAAFLGLLGTSLGGCSIFDNPITYGVQGWEIACIQWGEYEELLADSVCLWKQVDGGVTPYNMSAACAQVRNDVHGENLTPADYPDAQIWENNGDNGQCLVEDVGELDAHLFPVTEIEDFGSDPNDNFIWCIPHQEIEITNGEGSYEVFVEAGRCVDPDLTPEENCEELCEAWQAGYPGYDEFTQGEGQGDCGTDNWSYFFQYEEDCSAYELPGAILASNAVLSFSDPLNSVTALGTGALIYDDTECQPRMACEPKLFFKVETALSSYVYTDAAGGTYDISLSNVTLGTLHEVQTYTDAASGGLALPRTELVMTVDDVTVDGISFGAAEGHELMGDATLTSDPTTNSLVVTGSIHVPNLGGVDLDLTITADLGSTMAEWPWSVE